jgi:hypothetical protein
MRAFNRILAVLLAVAIAVAGVLTVIEVIAAATDNDPVIVKWHGLVGDLASNEWKTAGPRVAAIILILVGLLLLLFALRRGKPATVALTTDAPAVDMTTTRRSLQRSLATTATTVDGITDASVKVKRRKIVVKARAASGVTKEDGRARLSDEMQGRLDRLSLADSKRLKVKVIPDPDKGTPDEPAGLTSPEPTGDLESQDREPVGASGSSGSTSTGGTA